MQADDYKWTDFLRCDYCIFYIKIINSHMSDMFYKEEFQQCRWCQATAERYVQHSRLFKKDYIVEKK